MSNDFRTEQIQVKQIISSGTLANGSGAKLVIYPIEAQGSPNNTGIIDQALFNTSSLNGTDVFLFVSGGIEEKGTSNRSVAVFGGDAHISGGLSVETNFIKGTNDSIQNSSTNNAILSINSSITDSSNAYIFGGDNVAINDSTNVCFIGPLNGTIRNSTYSTLGGVLNVLSFGGGLYGGQYSSCFGIVNLHSSSNTANGILNYTSPGSALTSIIDSNYVSMIGGNNNSFSGSSAIYAIGSNLVANDETVTIKLGGRVLATNNVPNGAGGVLSDTEYKVIISASNGFHCSSSYFLHIPSFKQTTYTVQTSDYIIPISSSGAGTTVILDSTQSIIGRQLIIKDIGGNAATYNLTISSSYGKIDGSSTYIISLNYGSVTLCCFNSSDSNNTWGIL